MVKSIFIAIVFCWMTVAAAAGAVEEPYVLSVLPANPTTVDFVEARIVLETTNFSYLASMEIEGRVITLHFIDVCYGLCGGFELVEHIIPLGQLEPGDWRIEGTMTQLFGGDTFPLEPLDFQVAAVLGRAKMKLHPALPTQADSLELQVAYATAPCEARPRLGEVERVGNTFKVELDLADPEMSCVTGEGQYGSLLAELGQLPPGAYHVELLGQPADASPAFPLDTLDFQVGPSPESAELLGRFRASLRWRTPAGLVGTAQRVAGGSDESVLFSFFAPGNWEVMVKVLDGCAINGNYWVFLAAATDVEFTLTVEDLEGGAPSYIYTSPSGLYTPPLGDTAAFACSP